MDLASMGMGQEYDPQTDAVHDRLSEMEPLDLSLDLGEEEEGRLSRLIVGEIDRYLTATKRRRENLVVWRLCYELMPPGTANRWQNSSDIPSALTRIYCNSHYTRLNQQILNAVPPFVAVAKEPAAKEVAAVIEEAMGSVLEAAQWPQVAADLHRELVVAGNVFLRVTYEQETARLPKRQVETSDDTLRSLIAAGVDLHEASWHSVKKVKFGHVEQPVYDGVRYKVIPFEDGVICPPTCRDPEKAFGIGERLRLRGADLKEGVRQGFYREEAVEKLLATMGDPEPMERLTRKDEQGLMMDSTGGGFFAKEEALYREYEVYELCWQWDADDDGRLEWIVVHLHHATRAIIGLRWLEYEHGRPYYMMERYILRTAELFAMGIPEMLSCYHDADTNVINQIVDHGDLSLNIGGNFAYTGLSGYDPDKTILQLGRPLKFENLAETEFKPLPALPLPTEHYQLSQRFKDLCDLLTASSNPSLGKATDTSKTLGEVQIVTNASNQIFEDYAGSVARQHAKAWDHARWLTAQYGLQNPQGEVTYRRTAAPNVVDFASIKPSDLAAKVDLVPTGIEQLSDMGSRIQQSVMILTQLMQLLTSVQAWMPFAPVVLTAFGAYMKALNYPQRDKLLQELEQALGPLVMQQMQMQAAMAMQGGGTPGGAPAPPGGGMAPAPPGDLGGPPAPIPGPPALPPGSTSQNTFPAPQVPF